MENACLAAAFNSAKKNVNNDNDNGSGARRATRLSSIRRGSGLIRMKQTLFNSLQAQRLGQPMAVTSGTRRSCCPSSKARYAEACGACVCPRNKCKTVVRSIKTRGLRRLRLTTNSHRKLRISPNLLNPESTGAEHNRAGCCFIAPRQANLGLKGLLEACGITSALRQRGNCWDNT